MANTSRDLAAVDWCYDLVTTTLTIYPIVENVGSDFWMSDQEGSYVTEVGVPGQTEMDPHPLPRGWSL